MIMKKDEKILCILKLREFREFFCIYILLQQKQAESFHVNNLCA